ncbi:TonB-dependent receptor domain-containing protein [Brevundimonas sp.]|uniref:TonB-dependent receptor domain-containing protein n=1 Tax=Brevundimonas sp. TaxID=1871086 RepID=UPI0028966367|nr:TonB-dependent receptor [Brevundimonas sp.]
MKLALLTGVAAAAVATGAYAQSAPVQPAPVQSAPARTASAQPAPAQSAAPQTAPQEEPQARSGDADAEQDTAQDEPAQVEEVVVSARTDGIRTSIDSISYSLANDLQATTGSLADALRNVPSVDVDPQGNVSLRGNSGVTILVDGRPSPIFSGQSRGQAVLQLPADQYARIEVMTNPSAAYTPEGGGGIINLITKPTAPRPGVQTTGSVRLNVGDNGRWNAGISGSRQKDRLTLAGDLSYRYDANDFEFPTTRENLNPAGQVISTNTVYQESDTSQRGGFGRVSAEYKLTDRTTFSAELSAMKFDIDPRNTSFYETRDANNVLTNAYQSLNTGGMEIGHMNATARVVHRFNDQGHEWSNELRYGRQDSENDFLLETTYTTPVAPVVFERFNTETKSTMIGFTSAYVLPMGEDERLRAGYELTRVEPENDVRFLRGPSANSLAPVAGLSNLFEGTQTVHALYTTYERGLTDKLSVQAGLRLEQADIEVNDLTGGLKAGQDYFRAYPTGHLQYQLSETQTLRASYSRRIQRPQLTQLNPFVSYQSPLYRSSGNPNLRPQETDAFEAMWQVRKGQNFYQATLYYRDTDKAFTEVATQLADGVLLTRPENLGGRTDTGIELTAAGRLHSTLRYNAAINAFHQEIDAGGIPGGKNRSGEMVSGRLSLNWQPTAKDFVQLSGFWQGESLLAQGTREAGGMVNLGYRRKLTDKLSLNVTGRDLFNSMKNSTRYETDQFREFNEQNINLRAFYIGLSWQLGSSPRRQPEQFDFSTGPTGG